MEALDVLVKHVKPTPEDRHAIDQFKELSAAIKTYRALHEQTPGEVLDTYLSGNNGHRGKLLKLVEELKVRMENGKE
jgi:hypothetical protein